MSEQRITYLSAEQRLSYLVKVDDAGCLRWSSTNELVDTTAGRWKDSDGSGIIPEDVPDRSVPRRGSFEYIDSPDSSSVESNAAMHYAETTKGSSNWSKLFYRYFTIRGVTDRLLRKTVRRNTWIYCTDKNYNLFIGIKHTGSFQHSSFLAGGIVTSAGLISVKDGLIHTLSPLSGHYRTSIDQFHHFIDILTERGVDMSKVKVSKAEAALWGIEHLTKLKKKQTHLKEVGKEQVSKLGHAAADTLKIGDLHWKREILEGRNWDAKDDKDNTSPKTTDENPRVVVEKGNRGRSDQESNDTL
ncbi:hypothetical protein D9757_005362 [Collybiopsis confluens]|uniref:Uncharacterized protein n=1 Tax=Collybiopsis confluens TaxID=2823264 RepID=A0A8H5HLH9_9AGAR|nr:hypothetical protein D9757_005362 [Collybiopsis confluens]